MCSCRGTHALEIWRVVSELLLHKLASTVSNTIQSFPPPHTLCSFFVVFNFVGGCVAALKLTFFFTVQARVARRAHTLALDTAAAILALNVGLADISHDLAAFTCRVT